MKLKLGFFLCVFPLPPPPNYGIFPNFFRIKIVTPPLKFNRRCMSEGPFLSNNILVLEIFLFVIVLDEYGDPKLGVCIFLSLPLATFDLLICFF